MNDLIDRMRGFFVPRKSGRSAENRSLLRQDGEENYHGAIEMDEIRDRHP